MRTIIDMHNVAYTYFTIRWCWNYSANITSEKSTPFFWRQWFLASKLTLHAFIFYHLYLVVLETQNNLHVIYGRKY